MFGLPSARRLPAVVHERTLATAIPRVRGHFSLAFYSRLYEGFSYGANPRCWGKLYVTMAEGSSITIGDDFWLVSDARRAGIALYARCKLRTMKGASIVIGDQVALNGTSITSRESVKIGSRTIIAANVVIVDSDFHQHWPPEGRFFGTGTEGDRPVTIGNCVWIGMGSLILKGVTIGDNSIIAAGSVVTRSIPPNVLAGGVPARVIRPIGEEQ